MSATQPIQSVREPIFTAQPGVKEKRLRKFVRLLWVAVLLSIVVWALVADAGWDTRVLLDAVHSVHAGHDPYADAMAIQQAFHSTLAEHPNAPVPWSYVYSPITLPLLRAAGSIPVWLAGGLFYFLYILGMMAQLWVTYRAVALGERRIFRWIAPVAIFFPGLLASGIVMGGNIVYILYGAAFLAAWYGWQRRSWTPFYLVVIVASCFKPPLLSWLVIPVFSAKRQWIPAGVTAALGTGIFLSQRLVFPTLFLHFIEAVDLQFRFNRDFGSSPAGLLGGILYDRHIPYSPFVLIFYLLYAIPILGVLWHLSRRFLPGDLTLNQWMPVLLVGVILLNPRIQEYDLSPLTLPMALIVWRLFTRFTSKPVWAMASCFLVLNTIALQDWLVWKATEGALLAVVFAAGAWMLHTTRSTPHRDALEA